MNKEGLGMGMPWGGRWAEKNKKGLFDLELNLGEMC